MSEIIQVLHKWTANIMIILFIYSSIMWFWLANDKDKIKNVSFYTVCVEQNLGWKHFKIY